MVGDNTIKLILLSKNNNKLALQLMKSWTLRTCPTADTLFCASPSTCVRQAVPVLPSSACHTTLPSYPLSSRSPGILFTTPIVIYGIPKSFILTTYPATIPQFSKLSETTLRHSYFENTA